LIFEMDSLQTVVDQGEIEAEAEAPLTVIGPEGQPLAAGRDLWLGVEKFRRPRKHYRLIWLWPAHKQVWLACEDEQRYRRKSEAEQAGQVLAESLGVRFSPITR
jgi:hypothetical protein